MKMILTNAYSFDKKYFFDMFNIWCRKND